jgi:hypothetical protein
MPTDSLDAVLNRATLPTRTCSWPCVWSRARWFEDALTGTTRLWWVLAGPVCGGARSMPCMADVVLEDPAVNDLDRHFWVARRGASFCFDPPDHVLAADDLPKHYVLHCGTMSSV